MRMAVNRLCLRSLITDPKRKTVEAKRTRMVLHGYHHALYGLTRSGSLLRRINREAKPDRYTATNSTEPIAINVSKPPLSTRAMLAAAQRNRASDGVPPRLTEVMLCGKRPSLDMLNRMRGMYMSAALMLLITATTEIRRTICL